ncbi:hypothetical protein OPV22_024670 [Ensete ventricosum]|uniref:Ubiquitin-related modifier 1 homolog n=1 Tax=Ensete ventricosum TaxID=4639 RepID=A0AAV8QFJ4_ENSVE|nr:hypothetical protein OPV22_024670 [Ensete ventricosum]
MALLLLLLLLLLVHLLVLVNGVKVWEVRAFDHARRLLDPGDVTHVVLALHPLVVLLLLLAPFGGGLELLCQSTKIHSVDVKPNPREDKLTMRDLLAWVKSNLIKERPEMFMKGDSVRPGVLVLINDCDLELCGSLELELEEKDVVVFISTLHGG